MYKVTFRLQSPSCILMNTAYSVKLAAIGFLNLLRHIGMNENFIVKALSLWIGISDSLGLLHPDSDP
jgi:hypothetical protein